MKKFLFILSCACLVSCNNYRNQDKTNDSNTSEVITKTITSKELQTSQSSEITLDFSSYHLYTCEEDKYDEDGYQPVSAKVTIDEENKKASLKLYDSGENKWYPFSFRIEEKMMLQEGVVTYTVYNNVNKTGYIYVSTNRANGLFIDINNFYLDGNAICCWMQEGGSNGAEYRKETRTYAETTNTYSSTQSSTSNFNNGSIHSDEKIYGNYYNYEETDYCVEGVVVYEGEDDYYILETKRGYTILNRHSGGLFEGNKVRGELNRYGSKYLINRNNNTEIKVFIEEFALSDDDAVEWMGKNDHLKTKDQETYDYNNN